MNKNIHKIPCDECLHRKVCTVRTCFEETKIETTHPYVKVTLECTEFMSEKILVQKPIFRDFGYNEKEVKQ